MRRLSAFLMMAALLAVLVPSAALAGRPAPSITRVDVSGSSGSTAPNCSLLFWVGFSGTASEVRYTSVVADVPGTPWTAALPRKADSIGGEYAITDLATTAISWKVELLDRKGKVLDTETTPAEWWTSATLCPQAGLLASTQVVTERSFQSFCVAMEGAYLASSLIAGIGITVAPYCDLPDASAAASLADMCWDMGRIGSIYETTWEMGCSEYIPDPGD